MDWVKQAEKDMQKLHFVQWDRVHGDGFGGYVFFGWIKREDAHEDYVQLEYDAFGSLDSFHTSSEKFSEKINSLLGFTEKNHSKCERIENLYQIKNVIHLKEEKS